MRRVVVESGALGAAIAIELMVGAEHDDGGDSDRGERDGALEVGEGSGGMVLLGVRLVVQLIEGCRGSSLGGGGGGDEVIGLSRGCLEFVVNDVAARLIDASLIMVP